MAKMISSPHSLATGIGALPHKDPKDACRDVLEIFPSVPYIPTLPDRGLLESIVFNDSEQLPGRIIREGRLFFDSTTDQTAAMEQVYLDYIEENFASYALHQDYASVFTEMMTHNLSEVGLLKYQITGPVTFGMQVVDANKRPIYYDNQLADVLAKMLALKARWCEVEMKEKTGAQETLIVLNEPYLATLGSSVVPVDKETVKSGWEDIASLVKGGLGIHCCSNTDWEFILALNPSKEIQQQFAQAGAGPLPPELAARVPQTDFSDPFQRALLEAVFKGHSVGGKPSTLSAEARAKMFDSFYRTQILWEESMASRIVRYLNSPAGAGKKMVVIAGAFHVRHGLGVPRKVLRRAAWPYVIVLPTEISIPEEHKEEELMMDVDIPKIPLLAGDFAWLIPYENIKSQKARLGVSMRVDAGTVVIDKVVPGSPAQQVGLKTGDVFIALDNFPVNEPGDVSIVIGGKKPGDGVKVQVRRGGQEMLFAPLLSAPPEHPAKPYRFGPMMF
ncbi:MAG: hypothetical protein CVU24_10290 [Betaproteobacteria bacterium HGW-Betaproteobacteria-18]|nr:MAG: hypothetical protein CVU24_10290 [Betaproteobacteria bacterium HGW-Betaproteobacteria-18]